MTRRSWAVAEGPRPRTGKESQRLKAHQPIHASGVTPMATDSLQDLLQFDKGNFVVLVNLLKDIFLESKGPVGTEPPWQPVGDNPSEDQLRQDGESLRQGDRRREVIPADRLSQGVCRPAARESGTCPSVSRQGPRSRQACRGRCGSGHPAFARAASCARPCASSSRSSRISTGHSFLAISGRRQGCPWPCLRCRRWSPSPTSPAPDRSCCQPPRFG